MLLAGRTLHGISQRQPSAHGGICPYPARLGCHCRGHAGLAATDSNRRRSVEDWNVPQRRVYPSSHQHLADEFTVADLRKRGVSHVAIQVDNDTAAALRKKDKLNARQEKIRAFLDDLESQSELVWSCKSQTPAYLNPTLRLYALKLRRRIEEEMLRLCRSDRLLVAAARTAPSPPARRLTMEHDVRSDVLKLGPTIDCLACFLPRD